MAFVPFLLMAAVSAVGAVKSGQQQKVNADFQSRMALRDQQVAERQAKAAEMKAAYDQQRFRSRAASMMAATRAQLGASGALMGTGTPLAILGSQAAELALDSSMIGYNAMVGAAGYRDQGSLDAVQSKMYTQAGKSAQEASYWKAGSSIMQGFGSAYSSGAFSGE